MSNVSAVETFEQLIRQQKSEEIVPFLLQLDKKNVVPVRQKTKSLKKELEEYKHRDVNGKAVCRPLITEQQKQMLFLAALATYSRKEAFERSFDNPWPFMAYTHDQGASHFLSRVLEVLEGVRPVWLTEWLIRDTRDNPWRAPRFDTLADLLERKLIEPDSWLLAQAAARQLAAYGKDADIALSLAIDAASGTKLSPLQVEQWAQVRKVNPSLAAGAPFPTFEQLLLRDIQANAALLAVGIPSLFDYDTGVDSAYACLYRYGPYQTSTSITWLTVLPQLVGSGDLDRADLLTRCLLALRRDFRRPLLTWFKSLFLALQPTAAERLARQAELVELLAHPLPLVVHFALDQVKDLWTNSEFSPSPLLLYPEALLPRQDLKTSLRTLLAGFEKLLKRDPTLAPTLGRLSASALANADAGVQERAAKLLVGLFTAKKSLLSPEDATEIIESIRLYAELLHPPARQLVAPFLMAPATDQSAPDDPVPATVAATYTPHTGFEPELSLATAIAPVQDWHELLFLTGQLLQHDEPATLERWLDGLLRLRPQFPPGYEQQLRPYLQQAMPWVVKSKPEAEIPSVLLNYEFDTMYPSRRDLVRALLIGWATGFARPKVAQISLVHHQYHKPDPLLRVEQQRLLAVEEQLTTATTPLPLLSTPTHAPCWVAPSVLVQKLLAYQTASQEPNAADLALALARAAVQARADRADAHQHLHQLQNEKLRELLEWFLAPAAELPLTFPAALAESKSRQKVVTPFSSEAPMKLPDALPALWSVAARTRYPQVVLEELRALADYPGVAAPWQPGWHFQRKSHTYNQKVTHVWQELHLSVEHVSRQPPSPLLLYSLHVKQKGDDYGFLESMRFDGPFLLTLLPNNPSPLHWHLLRNACCTSDAGSLERDTLHRFLPSLLGAGPHFEEAATVLLALALTHHAPICRALALEVLLSAIEAGRFQPAALGTALGKILAVEFVPVQRLNDNLAQARAISPLIDDALRQTLNALLPLLPTVPPRNTRKLIDAYADLTSRTQQPVPEAVQARLWKWSSSASLKKAAGALLQASTA